MARQALAIGLGYVGCGDSEPC